MKRKIMQEIILPEGVECRLDSGFVKCKKGEIEISKKISAPGIKVEFGDGKIKVLCEKGNKKDRAIVGAYTSHVKNILRGLEEKYSYELEICYVHFPMTVKVESNRLSIDNFLGEKAKRYADIIEGVEVEVKGNKIIVSGYDVEATGQTAANIESATKVPKKDRRIFQDGIFITAKKGVHI